MKSILTLLIILGAQLIATPNAEARTHSNSHRYVSSRTSCGCPIYTQRYVSYFDRCGHPVYRYRTEPVRHQCRPRNQYQQPVYRPQHRSHRSHRTQRPAVRTRCGTTRSYGHYRRATIYGFPR